MKTFKQILVEAKSFIGYHNVTSKKVRDDIIKTGFKLKKKVARKRLYGNGIYFSFNPDSRYGDEYVEVQLTPKNPLLDYAGDINYENNPLGLKIEAIGKAMDKNFHMSDSKKKALAIEKYLSDNKHDMLITMEYDKNIYVVRDPKIIKIVPFEV